MENQESTVYMRTTLTSRQSASAGPRELRRGMEGGGGASMAMWRGPGWATQFLFGCY